jgi:hypothetical protein
MPGAGCTHGPLCDKKAQGQEPQVHRINPASPARWFYGFLRALLGDHCLVATVVRRIVPRELSACFGAPEPHDFAVRRNIIRPRACCAPDAAASIASCRRRP